MVKSKGRCRLSPIVLMAVFVFLVLGGCADTYYGAMEKVGVHKRDIMVDRVESARDAQKDAQEQFQSALMQFDAVVKLKETDLKKAYDKLNEELEQSRDAADTVSSRIAKVEAVADALFEEWGPSLICTKTRSYVDRAVSSWKKPRYATRQCFPACIRQKKVWSRC